MNVRTNPSASAALTPFALPDDRGALETTAAGGAGALELGSVEVDSVELGSVELGSVDALARAAVASVPGALAFSRCWQANSSAPAHSAIDTRTHIA
ncbi:MAG TPA: hypothetical protein VFQ35_18710 [Polyangiaceae bacterium]|nr:hypothetical protein [Polyangiaceae bacterium]